MTLPELVIFDYGHTLIYEEHFNITKGAKAIYSHILSCKENVCEQEFSEFAVRLYEALAPARRKLALEVPATSFTRILREYYGIEFDCGEICLQEIFWDGISPPHAIEGANDMLKTLKSMGIKTAVISNLWYEEDVLKRRIERLLPEQDFSFYMSTCNYGFRKPNKLLFDLAVKRAGTTSDKAWFCGDEPNADINGAYEAGLTPVWFKADMDCPYKFKTENAPDVPHILIKSWKEFTDILK